LSTRRAAPPGGAVVYGRGRRAGRQAALSGGGDDAAFHRHIAGINGFDAAHRFGKYQQVVGADTPHVARIIFAPFVPPAGVPQTPSNR
jgi:hypothetical protein